MDRGEVLWSRVFQVRIFVSYYDMRFIPVMLFGLGGIVNVEEDEKENFRWEVEDGCQSMFR